MENFKNQDGNQNNRGGGIFYSDHLRYLLSQCEIN